MHISGWKGDHWFLGKQTYGWGSMENLNGEVEEGGWSKGRRRK